MNCARVFAVAVLSLFALPLLAGQTDKRLDIYWVDVEGGAATLIVTPAGESVLIDSGNPGERDSGRIFTVTKIAGLKQIDCLITTHYHIDHFGGAAALSKLIPIKKVYDNGAINPSRDKPDAAYLSFAADQRIVLNPGDLIPLAQADGSPKLEIKCIGTRKRFIDPPAGAATVDASKTVLKDNDLTDNANSIVNVLSFGGFRFFDGGDLTWNIEAKLMTPANRAGEVDVYQVNHHGLDVSNNPLLVNALSPTVAVMSNGTKKGCGSETFATLKKLPGLAAIYQIHRNLRPDGDQANTELANIANLEEKCEGNYIKLSVDPAGKSYTVGIPATKLERTFQVKAAK